MSVWTLFYRGAKTVIAWGPIILSLKEQLSNFVSRLTGATSISDSIKQEIDKIIDEVKKSVEAEIDNKITKLRKQIIRYIILAWVIQTGVIVAILLLLR